MFSPIPSQSTAPPHRRPAAVPGAGRRAGVPGARAPVRRGAALPPGRRAAVHAAPRAGDLLLAAGPGPSAPTRRDAGLHARRAARPSRPARPGAPAAARAPPACPRPRRPATGPAPRAWARSSRRATSRSTRSSPRWCGSARPTCTSPRAPRRWCASTARCKALDGFGQVHARGAASHALRVPHAEAAREVRDEPRARPVLLRARPRAVPREHLPAARVDRRRVPRDPVRDQAARGARRARRSSARSPACRAGSSWSPGPTGSGKSTTLASIVDLANRTREDHIMTVEDPIEFLHRHKKCAGQPARGRRRTRTRSPTRSSTCCARTPTSSSSARCVTSRRSRSP